MGLVLVGVYTSHVTGSVARLGDALVERRGDVALGAAVVVAAFLVGAMVAALLVDRARRRARALYAAPLLVEVGLLAVFALVAEGAPGLPAVALGALAGAMGLQNALVSRLSGAVVRTTHVTGIVTDLGVDLVRRVAERGERHGARLAGRRIRLQLLVLASFFAGAVAGPWLALTLRTRAVLAPSAVLCALAAFDLARGIRATP